MKCMFVIDSNLSGGAERVISILVNYFSSKKDEVILLNFDRDSNFYHIDDGVKVIKLAQLYPQIALEKNRLLRRLLIIRKTRKMIKEIEPEVVVPFLFDAEMAVIPYCVRHSIPCITSVRNDADKYPQYQRQFRKHFYPKLAGIVFQSEAVMNHKDYSNLLNAYVIPNPVAMNLIEHRDISVDRNKIISVGRLTKQKNHELTILAMHRLVSDYPNLKLHIFGSGELKNDLQDLIMKYDLQNNVFLDGVKDNAQYVNRDAAAFVMASDYEGFPNALLEAMACHIPSICTDFNSGTAAEALLNGKAGWLVNVGDALGLENAIRECISDSSIAEKKADYAIEQCKKYSVSIIGEKWNDLIISVLKNNGD